MTTNPPEGTPTPTPDPTPDPATTSTKATPDTITAWAVYNETLLQYVGGVTRGAKPTAKDIKALREQYSVGADDTLVVRAV